MPSIGFIGAGAVATALSEKMSLSGYPVVAVSSRSGGSARRLAERLPDCSAQNNQAVAALAELVFIATPDDFIVQVCREIQWRPGQYVVHLSGASGTEKLEAAQRSGAQTGVFHPLQSFARDGASDLDGISFGIEAEEPLLGILKDLATSLGGRWLVIKPEDRALYHAGAIMAGNYLTTLVKLAADLWAKFGVPTDAAEKAMLPLIKGAVKNMEAMGLPDCLTGPIARGDTQTIERHLSALRRRAPEIQPVYCELGLKTIPIALARGGLDSPGAKQIEQMLSAKG